MPDHTREHSSPDQVTGASGAGAALFFAVWAVESQTPTCRWGRGAAAVAPVATSSSSTAGCRPSRSPRLTTSTSTRLALRWSSWSPVVFFCAALAAWRNERRVKLLTVCLLTLETASLGVLVSDDWILFLFFWTLPIVPVYLLVRGFGHGHGPGQRPDTRPAP